MPGCGFCDYSGLEVDLICTCRLVLWIIYPRLLDESGKGYAADLRSYVSGRTRAQSGGEGIILHQACLGCDEQLVR